MSTIGNAIIVHFMTIQISGVSLKMVNVSTATNKPISLFPLIKHGFYAGETHCATVGYEFIQFRKIKSKECVFMNSEQINETIVHCKVKANADIIARILDADSAGEEYFCISPDGTLLVDLPIATEKVNRVDLLNSITHIGSIYYAESEPESEQ